MSNRTQMERNVIHSGSTLDRFSLPPNQEEEEDEEDQQRTTAEIYKLVKNLITLRLHAVQIYDQFSIPPTLILYRSTKQENNRTWPRSRLR